MGKGKFLGEFEQLILLALIRLKKKAYGMTIRREIEGRTGRHVSIGAVYTTLERLETKGYVVSHIGEATPERGGRAKKYFEISAPGLMALEQSRRVLGQMWAGIRPQEA